MPDGRALRPRAGRWGGPPEAHRAPSAPGWTGEHDHRRDPHAPRAGRPAARPRPPRTPDSVPRSGDGWSWTKGVRISRKPSSAWLGVYRIPNGNAPAPQDAV